MIGRFWFYRRRRVLPFLAVYCLVFINGATLVPFVAPTAQAGIAASPLGGGAAGARHDTWHRARYERGRGRTERESVVAASVPPIVKNLRRPAPTRHFKVASWAGGRLAADSRNARVESVPRVPAGHAASLVRLCRFLL